MHICKSYCDKNQWHLFMYTVVIGSSCALVILLPRSDPPRRTLGDIVISNLEKYVHIITWPSVRLRCRTTAVFNTVQTSQSVDNPHRPFCCKYLWYDANVEQEAGQLLSQ